MVHIAENLQKARQYARSVNTVEEFKTVPMVKDRRCFVESTQGAGTGKKRIIEGNGRSQGILQA
jgi:hypothetical protein